MAPRQPQRGLSGGGSDSESDDDATSEDGAADGSEVDAEELKAAYAPSRFKVVAVCILVIARFRTEGKRKRNAVQREKQGRRLESCRSHQEGSFIGQLLRSTGLMSKTTEAVAELLSAFGQSEELDFALSWMHKMKVYTARACFQETIELLQRQLERTKEDNQTLKVQFKEARVDYLKEITSLRDHVRVRGDPESGMPSFDTMSFFSPESVLLPDELVFFHSALKEKVKMIFDTNPNVTSTIDFGQIERLKNCVENSQLEMTKKQLKEAKLEIASLESELETDIGNRKKLRRRASAGCLETSSQEEIIANLQSQVEEEQRRCQDADRRAASLLEEHRLMRESLGAQLEASRKLKVEHECVRDTLAAELKDQRARSAAELQKATKELEEQRKKVKQLEAVIKEMQGKEDFRKDLLLRRRHRSALEVEREENLESRESREGNSPLCSAAAAGDTDLLRSLVGAGADVNVADTDLRCPLHFAACEGWPEVVRCLVDEFSAEVNPIDRCGSTPLDEAMRLGHDAVVEFLEARGASCGAVEDERVAELEQRCNALEAQLAEQPGVGRVEEMEERCQQLEELLQAQLDAAAQQRSDDQVDSAQRLAEMASLLCQTEGGSAELASQLEAAEGQLSQLDAENLDVEKAFELGEKCVRLKQKKRTADANQLVARTAELALVGQRVEASDEKCCSCREELEATKKRLKEVQDLASELAMKLKATTEENRDQHSALSEVQASLTSAICSLHTVDEPNWGRSVSEGAEPQVASPLGRAVQALEKASKTVFHRLYYDCFTYASKSRSDAKQRQIWQQMQAALAHKYVLSVQPSRPIFAQGRRHSRNEQGVGLLSAPVDAPTALPVDCPLRVEQVQPYHPQWRPTPPQQPRPPLHPLGGRVQLLGGPKVRDAAMYSPPPPPPLEKASERSADGRLPAVPLGGLSSRRAVGLVPIDVSAGITSLNSPEHPQLSSLRSTPTAQGSNSDDDTLPSIFGVAPQRRSLSSSPRLKNRVVSKMNNLPSKSSPRGLDKLPGGNSSPRRARSKEDHPCKVDLEPLCKSVSEGPCLS